MSPKRLIPLEPAGKPQEPAALTDVVLALYLEDAAHDEGDDSEPAFDAAAVRQAATGAFALGCAVGIEFPQRVEPTLRQTHGDDAAAILAECKEPLTEQVQEAKSTGGQVAPELFLGSLFEALAEAGAVEANDAYNMLSIGFEYGCILATIDRAAAIVVRNGYNRRVAGILKQLEAGEPVELPPGPDPHQSLQELARELVEAYEKDVGCLGGGTAGPPTGTAQ